MKRISMLAAMALALCNMAWAQNPGFTHAFRLGGTGYDQGFELSVDAPGHVIVAGYFEGTVDFDPGAGTLNRTSAGLHDIFVAKYTTAGVLVWAHRIGGAGYDQATSVDVDGSGNVFVGGYFTGNVDFNPGAGTNTLGAGAADDAFVLKLDPAGNYLWANKVGGSGYDMSNGISTDAAGSVYLTGHFVNTVDFDPGPGTANLSSAGSMDMYLVKYSAAGAYQWAIRVGSSGFFDDFGYDIATFGTDVYVAGSFSGTVDFDPGPGTVSRTASSGNDLYLLKLSGGGAYQWVLTAGSTSTDDATGVDVDGLGNVYFAGGFENTVDFDPGPAVLTHTSAGTMDIFVGQVSPAGTLNWVQRIGTNFNEYAWQLAADAAGNSYFTGYTRSLTDFDPGPGTALVSNAGGFDAYLASLSPTGTYRFAFPIGAASFDVGYGVDVSECVLGITGYFEGTVDMDPSAATFGLSSGGGFDAYVGIYNACAVLPMTDWEASGEDLGGMRVRLRWSDAGAGMRYATVHEGEQVAAEDWAGTLSRDMEARGPGWNAYEVLCMDPEGNVVDRRRVEVWVEGAGAGPVLRVASMPADAGEIRVEWGALEGKGWVLELLDTQGRRLRRVEEVEAMGGGMRLRMDGLSAGGYMLRLSGPGGVALKRVLLR